MRTEIRIPLVRRRVGTRVLGSRKARQSRTELESLLLLEDELQIVCFSSLFDSELHGGHLITAHAPAFLQGWVIRVVEGVWSGSGGVEGVVGVIDARAKPRIFPG
jgi:hypothetical protein